MPPEYPSISELRSVFIDHRVQAQQQTTEYMELFRQLRDAVRVLDADGKPPVFFFSSWPE